MKYGKTLKEAREKAGLTQQEAAAILGWSQPTIAYYESNKREPTLSRLKEMATAYQTPLPIIVWGAVEFNDVKPALRDAFKSLKPQVDTLINNLFK